MIELKKNDYAKYNGNFNDPFAHGFRSSHRLSISFPEVHADACLEITFQRTLRIPDDDRTYPLPPGLGSFPMRHVDDFADRVPEKWRSRGGVMLPMYQAEAMWLSFSAPRGYPFAIKVGAGKINAVTGERWDENLLVSGEDQNYLMVPGQPWLDGFVVEKGKIRQFVAMPLGSGYSIEEQITKEAEFGGIQIQVFPLKKEKYVPPRPIIRSHSMSYGMADMPMAAASASLSFAASPDMGLGMGGSMRQEIYQDRRTLSDYDTTHTSRCFVHLVNALVWRSITGEEPPTTPPTSEEYTRAGLPWFDYYATDQVALKEGKVLPNLKSIKQMGEEKKDVPLPENTSVDPKLIHPIHAPKTMPNQVREGDF